MVEFKITSQGGISENDFEANFMHSLLAQLGLSPQPNKLDAQAAVERAKKRDPAVAHLISTVYVQKAYMEAIAWTRPRLISLTKEESQHKLREPDEM